MGHASGWAPRHPAWTVLNAYMRRIGKWAGPIGGAGWAAYGAKGDSAVGDIAGGAGRGALGGLAGDLPRLLEELRATRRASTGMSALGMPARKLWTGRLGLLAALSTYLLGAAGPAAVLGAITGGTASAHKGLENARKRRLELKGRKEGDHGR
jgi:hypothetical protein